MNTKLKLEKVRIQYSGSWKDVDGYRFNEHLTIHKSVNRRGRWTVTHNGTGHLLIDNVRSRSDALKCAHSYRRSVFRLRKKYGVSIQ